MIRPDYVPAPAWDWLTGEVVPLATLPGAQAAVPGLIAPEMAPSWHAWSDQVDGDLGWHLLCDFLALLPWTYRPQDVEVAGRLRMEWDKFVTDLDWLPLRAADINQRALALGFENPLSEEALQSLNQLANATRSRELRPVLAETDYLDAEHASAQTFVQHFDARWALAKQCRELWRVEMSHEDVARIGAATGSAFCTADAVRKARKRKPTPVDPHDPARGVLVLRNTGNEDPDN